MSPLPVSAAAGAAGSSAHEITIHVVCAWPVSGQYGPGSRVLYYVVVALCILGRRNDRLRNAALAVALVFPAVAALHGIVLAAVHVNGAIDMDVYGAFQLCSIGILAAPTTVRLSDTYKNATGRQIIFLWTGLMVAGLLSLVVEFYRAMPTACSHDNAGNPFTDSHPSKFPYSEANCTLTCSEESPISPMRGGAASNVYVIPKPERLSFNTALIIAVACCIPAILSLAFTTIQDLDNIWKSRFGLSNRLEDAEISLDLPIPGTNLATPRMMRNVESTIRAYLYYIEVPLFAAAVLAILVLGELNFFSFQVMFETEPIASIGQWGPIAGTVLAAFGTVYSTLASKLTPKEEPESDTELTPGIPRDSHQSSHGHAESTVLTRAATVISGIGDTMANAAHKHLDDSGFKTGEARGFPTIPGEEYRSEELSRIQKAYDPKREERGDITPVLGATRSRAGSFISVSSGLEISGAEAGPSTSSPPMGARRTSSPAKKSRRTSSPIVTATRSNTIDQCPSPNSPITPRRNTLEVPPLAYHR